MELTVTQKELVHIMKDRGVEKDSVVAILLALGELNKEREFLEYLNNSSEATAEDIMDKVVEFVEI